MALDKKNYLKEWLVGIIVAFVFTIFGTMGYGLGQGLEERQWYGNFNWYSFLCLLTGGILGQILQALIILEILGL